jgi:NADH-quinone oxidoreductase subunit M
MSMPWLSLAVFSPLLGVLALALIPRAYDNLTRKVAWLAAALPLAFLAPVAAGYVPGQPGFQFEDVAPWIPSAGIGYHLGVDGISLLLALLAAFLTVLAIWCARESVHESVKEFLISILVLEVGLVGVFLALDLVLFYVFWELVLIPMYLIIGIWGGEKRRHAAIKFVLFTVLGSVLMLVGIVAVYLYSGQPLTSDLVRIGSLASLPQGTQLWLFGLFFLAFAIKVPVVGLHTWLPDAHVEAPTAGSVLLAGVLLKMGAFGFIRYCIPLFPAAAQLLAPYIVVLGLVGLVYGALTALAQTDAKRLVAYSSVSHLGLVTAAIFLFNLQGLHGAVLQMVNHGLSTGALFLIVGLLYDRRHTHEMSAFGGLGAPMPRLWAIFLVVILSSGGLPGLNGFVGELLAISGAFHYAAWAGAVAASGLILGAAYLFWLFWKVMLGPVTVEVNRGLKDLSLRETAIFVPLIVLMFVIGLASPVLTRLMDASARGVLARVHGDEQRPPQEFVGGRPPQVGGRPPQVGGRPPQVGGAPPQVVAPQPPSRPAPPPAVAPPETPKAPAPVRALSPSEKARREPFLKGVAR